jgi:type-F conjugative transfer system secretin TraK
MKYKHSQVAHFKLTHPRVRHLSTLLTLTALAQPLMATPLRALQIYPLVDHQKTEFEISQTELNRIAVSGDRIQQVFGAEGLFDVQTDDEGGQIFLRLNRGESKPITVTLITEEGLTQDLKLIPQAIESQSILFKPYVKEPESHSAEKKIKNTKAPVLSLMKAMVRNEESDGFTKTACEGLSFVAPKIEALANLEMDCLSTYLGEQIEGKRYSLVNRGTTSLPLKEEDFAGPGDLALTLMKSTLHPQETTTLYIISRRPQ